MGRSALMDRIAQPFHIFMRWTYRLTPRVPIRAASIAQRLPSRAADIVWGALLTVLGALALWRIYAMIGTALTWHDAGEALALGAITMVRVTVLIALASVIWTPIGVYVGLRPHLARIIQPVAQFLAAFPANLLFPVAVFVIARYALNPDIALSPLMVLGTQWYILFNVIAGASAIPSDLREVAGIFGLRGWQWWRQVALPGIFPYYVTGAITASGGSWNASIVAEAVTWGDKHLEAAGLGAYIAKATATGDYGRVALGVAVMSIFVIAFNRVLWRPMYRFAERRLRLD